MLSFVKSQLPPLRDTLAQMSLSEPSNRMPGSIPLDDVSSRKSLVSEDAHDHDTNKEHAAYDASVQDHKEKEDEESSTDTSVQSEVFLIVHANLKRKSSHPYDLQVQLVRPKNRGRSTTTSSAGHHSAVKDDHTQQGLSRRPSFQSFRSTQSCRSDSNEQSLGRRMIPMYNLDYHHIRPKRVLDAGTDQVMAKFSKKGIELDGFGTLHSFEIGFIHEHHTFVGLQDSDEESNYTKSRDSMEQGAPTVTEQPRESRFMRQLRRFHRKFQSKSRSPPKTTRPSPYLRNMPKLRRINSDETYQGMLRAMVAAQNPQATPGAGSANGKITTSYVWGIKEYARHVTDEERLPHAEHPVLRGIYDGKHEAQSFKVTVADVIFERIWRQFSHYRRHNVKTRHPSHEDDISVWFEWVRDWNGGADNEHNIYDPAIHGPLESYPSPDRSVHSSPSTSPALLPRSDHVMKGTAEIAATDLGVPHQMAALPASTHSQQHLSIPGESDLASFSWTCYLVLNGDARIPIGQLIPAPHHPLIACELLLPSPLPGLRCLPIGADRNGFSREELRDIVTITALHLTLREKLGGLIDTAGCSS